MVRVRDTIVICGAAGWLAIPASAGDEPPGGKAGAAQPASRVIASWGEVIDPDNDCTVELKQGVLTIKVPGTDHTISVERNQMNAPRVLQAVDGDFIAQVKVAGQFPKGAVSAVPTRRPCHGAGLLLWADEKTYVRLERAELVVGDTNHHYANWELRKNGEFVKRGTALEFPLADQPTWFRLERRGGKVHGSVSTDGAKWSSLRPIEVELPAKVQVGIVAGHNTSSGYTPTFDEFQIFLRK